MSTITAMLRTVIVVLLVAAVLAGAALAGDPRQQHTAADMARAKAVGFVRSDFPATWTAKPSTPSGNAGSGTCKSFDPDQSDLVETGKVDSPEFTAPDGFSQVASSVGVFRTVAQAKTSWARVVRPSMIQCFSQLITATAPKGSTISELSKGVLAFPKVASRTTAYRLVLGVTPQGATTPVKLYLDLVFLGADRVNVSTIMFSLGQPYQAAFEQKLARAIAHRLG
jgi:hypothetical protein